MSRARHYPTPITTTFYIGQYLIDDVYRVDFTRKVTHQPIWGYASKQYDFIAKGREIVTGNIIINFRYPGYLTNAIKVATQDSDTNKVLVKSGIKKDSKQSLGNLLDDIHNVNSISSVMEKISNILLGTKINNSQQENTASLSNINEINETYNELKKSLVERHTKQFSKLDTGVKHLESPLSIELPLFDLEIQYGFQGVSGGWRRIFKDITLVGESQVIQAGGDGSGMGSSAQCLLEAYPFFASSTIVKRTV